jgi:hypothetical protein
MHFMGNLNTIKSLHIFSYLQHQISAEHTILQLVTRIYTTLEQRDWLTNSLNIFPFDQQHQHYP